MNEPTDHLGGILHGERLEVERQPVPVGRIDSVGRGRVDADGGVGLRVGDSRTDLPRMGGPTRRRTIDQSPEGQAHVHSVASVSPGLGSGALPASAPMRDEIDVYGQPSEGEAVRVHRLSQVVDQVAGMNLPPWGRQTRKQRFKLLQNMLTGGATAEEIAALCMAA